MWRLSPGDAWRYVHTCISVQARKRCGAYAVAKELDNTRNYVLGLPQWTQIIPHYYNIWILDVPEATWARCLRTGVLASFIWSSKSDIDNFGHSPSDNVGLLLLHRPNVRTSNWNTCKFLRTSRFDILRLLGVYIGFRERYLQVILSQLRLFTREELRIGTLVWAWPCWFFDRI